MCSSSWNSKMAGQCHTWNMLAARGRMWPTPQILPRCLMPKFRNLSWKTEAEIMQQLEAKIWLQPDIYQSSGLVGLGFSQFFCFFHQTAWFFVHQTGWPNSQKSQGSHAERLHSLSSMASGDTKHRHKWGSFCQKFDKPFNDWNIWQRCDKAIFSWKLDMKIQRFPQAGRLAQRVASLAPGGRSGAWWDWSESFAAGRKQQPLV